MFRKGAKASVFGLAILVLALDAIPLSMPRRVATGPITLSPLAHTFFCLRYPVECMLAQPARDQVIALVPETRRQLETVNRDVNFAIAPVAETLRGPVEAWLLYPEFGDCNDYAVTKRHELFARGWPAKALLLAEVRIRATGEHHLVLVVRTHEADLVLDNLRPEIRVWSATVSDYRWIRIQSTGNPKLWTEVRARG